MKAMVLISNVKHAMTHVLKNYGKLISHAIYLTSFFRSDV